MPKIYPNEITSYDILKSVVVVTMIVDHLGAYLLPDIQMLRAIGRASAPAWMFLIGFAESRDFSPRLWISAGVLVFACFVFGPTIFPLNILVTILLTRWGIDKVAHWYFSSFSTMILLSLGATLLLFPSLMLADYGIAGFAIALFGYLVRRPKVVKMKQVEIIGFGIFGFTLSSLVTLATFRFSAMELQCALFLTAMLFVALYKFRPAAYPQLTASLPRFITCICQCCGRRTLEIYVAHLLLFKSLAVYLEIGEFALWHWRWL